MLKTRYAFASLLLLTACTMQQPPEKAAKQLTIEELMKNQVLLTNHAEFTDDRTLNGASAFLIHFRDSVYAVTATHLIGPDGGVEPAVPITSLAADLLEWKMYPRVPVQPATDTITASASHLDYSRISSDALLLKTVAPKAGILPLEPNFNDPATGDTVYLIGCPYSESGCKQNVYKMTFNSADSAFCAFEIFSDINISGFSGAPIVDATGKVLAILKSSGDIDGKHFVGATPIREILKVK